MKMRILMINTVCGIKSTGRICTDLANDFAKEGHEVKIAYGRDIVPKQFETYALRIGTDFDVYMHGIESRLFDNTGFGSRTATDAFLRWADEYNPDLLWLHNIHGYYINIQKLFRWIKTRPEMQVKWTLHDCWAFTGHCTYFTMIGCDKWKTHCCHCPLRNEYPESFVIDCSYQNFEKKRDLFTGVKHMELITPSQWLADLTRDSFLKEYPVKVVYNKINREIFKPTLGNFREKYHLEGKKIILGVANPWTKRKGLDDFLKLSTMLNDEYVIVLVGLSKKQIEELPKKVIGLKRTDSPEELATIYTASDVFVNPSKEETFGMTTLEAVSCGTDAIVLEGTACEEVVHEFGGIAVKPGVKNLYKAITGKDYVEDILIGGAKVYRIICLQRTNKPVELAKLYTAADWFVNPTYEDNFPTVNLEAIACGTKVITYDTGGCTETLRKF